MSSVQRPENRTTSVRGRVTSTDSRAKALTAARAALEKHAQDVVVMDLRALSSVTDYFIICTATSSRQLRALREHIEVELSKVAQEVWHVEGATVTRASTASMMHEPQWLLMDCGDLVVHLLDVRAREFYQLERLWGDAPRLPIAAA